MALLNQEKIDEYIEQKDLLRLLDEGIADMEEGRTVRHEEAMKIIKERLGQYDV